MQLTNQIPKEYVTELVIMAVERVFRNCAYFKVRRAKPYYPLIKHRVSENYTCGRFKPKQT